MSYFNLKFRVNFLGHVKNVIINVLFYCIVVIGIVVENNMYVKDLDWFTRILIRLEFNIHLIMDIKTLISKTSRYLIKTKN